MQLDLGITHQFIKPFDVRSTSRLDHPRKRLLGRARSKWLDQIRSDNNFPPVEQLICRDVWFIEVIMGWSNSPSCLTVRQWQQQRLASHLDMYLTEHPYTLWLTKRYGGKTHKGRPDETRNDVDSGATMLPSSHSTSDISQLNVASLHSRITNTNEQYSTQTGLMHHTMVSKFQVWNLPANRDVKQWPGRECEKLTCSFIQQWSAENLCQTNSAQKKETSGQSNLTQPQYRHARIVQLYSSGGANVYSHLTNGYSSPQESVPPKRRLNWFSRFYWAHWCIYAMHVMQPKNSI